MKTTKQIYKFLIISLLLFCEIATGQLRAPSPVSLQPRVDGLNSTYDPLNDTETFTGSCQRRQAPSLVMSGSSDKDFTFRAKFYTSLALCQSDVFGGVGTPGLTSESTLEYDHVAGAVNLPRPLEIAREYYRVEIENNSGENMTRLTFQTSIGRFNPLFSRLDSSIALDADATIVRSIGTSLTPDNAYEAGRQSGYFTGGSTSTPLGANGEFVGDWLDASKYSNILFFISADQPYDDTFYTDSFGVTSGIVLDISNNCQDVDFTFAIVTLSNPPVHYFKAKPLLRCARIRYRNEATPQSSFFISLIAEAQPSPQPSGPAGGEFTLASLVTSVRSLVYGQDQADGQLKRLPMIPLGTIVNNAMDSLVAKAVNIAEDATGTYGRIGRILDSLKVAVTEFTDDVLIQPNNGIWSTQISVSSQNRILIPTAPPSIIETPRRITIDNTSYNTSVYLGNGIVTQLNGFRIYDQPHSMVFGGESHQELYLIAEAGGGNETNTILEADTIDNNVGVTNPTDIFTENATSAIFDSISDTITISGFDSSVLPVGEEIEGVSLNLVARKDPTQLFETSQYVATFSGVAGDVQQVSTQTFTPNPNSFYIVAISRRDEFANTTNVSSNQGFEVIAKASVEDVELDTLQQSAESRVDIWYMYDTDGVVQSGQTTASLSQGADYVIISASEFTGINRNDPFESFVTFGANNSGGTYSNSVSNGVSKGQFIAAFGLEQGTHTTASNPAGATEKFEGGSASNNNQIQAIVTANLLTTGTVNFNGTVTGNDDISYIGFTLNPSPSENPVLRLSHSEGISTFDVEIDNTSYLETKYDITADAAFTTALIDGMDITLEVPSIGSANAQVDEFALDIFTATDSVRVTIKIEGDAP